MRPLPSSRYRLFQLAALLLLAILVPFVLLEDLLQSASAQWLDATRSSLVVHATVIALLLAADILLPVPSSLLSIYAGYELGVVWGAAASWTGMTLGVAVGYAVGRTVGTSAARRIAGQQAWEAVVARIGRWGVWLILFTRPLPVLAEAAVLAAGSARMPVLPLAVASSAANLAISLVYASAGAAGTPERAGPQAIALALLLPLAGWGIAYRLRRQRREAST